MPLNDTQLRNLKPASAAKKYSDSGGLYLHVTPKGSKLWRMAYRYAGKQKTLSFGPYPTVSLADARRKRDEAKVFIAEGQDPSAVKQQAALELQRATEHSFNAIADELIAKLIREGKAESTLSKKRWLLDFARKAFGAAPITEIKASDILAVLREIERLGHYETAKRVRGAVGQVFRFAIATARAEIDPTAGLRGAIAAPTVTHRAALVDANAYAGLIRAIWHYEGAVETAAALKLMALLYPRPGELRLAQWREFDFKKRVWTIHASRAKMRREHRKPLSTLSLSILEALHQYTGAGALVFPSVLSVGKPISENTLNGALRRLGFGKDEATAHGFRSSASSILNESGLWSPDAIEAELAHLSSDQVRRAYHRATYWDERVRMCEWWAEWILLASGEKSAGLQAPER